MTLKTTLALAAALLVAAPAMAEAQGIEAPAGTYKIDPSHASVSWKVRHLGLSNYVARFTKFDATLTIDPAKPEAASLTATVDPLSLKTDYPFTDKVNFDKELSESDKWLNGKVHKAITFTSTKVERTGDRTAKVTGNLTLAGVTKPVTLDVTLIGALKDHPFMKKPALGFSATGTFKRSEFGITTYIGPVVSDEVTLQIEAEMIGG